MQPRDRAVLENIIRYCDRIAGYLETLKNSRERFMEDQMCQDACCMCIAQIGEMSARLSDEYKAATAEIPWREIKDTRNFYVHNYGGIDLSFVWITVTVELPALRSACLDSLQKE